jgi:uncharacterized protein (TIGR03086 family)
MDDLTLLAHAEQELSGVISSLDAQELDLISNCAPWTVRRLASHVLKNQLFWAGLVTGQDLMAQDEAMAAVPYEGALGPIAAEVTDRAVQLWQTPGVLAAQHATPFGQLQGAVVVNFALVDAGAHAWDLAASVGRPIEFPAEWIPGMSRVVELTCTEHAVEIGLIKAPTRPPAGATETQRLMALAGRTVAS